MYILCPWSFRNVLNVCSEHGAPKLLTLSRGEGCAYLMLNGVLFYYIMARMTTTIALLVFFCLDGAYLLQNVLLFWFADWELRLRVIFKFLSPGVVVRAVIMVSPSVTMYQCGECPLSLLVPSRVVYSTNPKTQRRSSVSGVDKMAG